MADPNQRIADLVIQYLKGDLNPEAMLELQAWTEASESNRMWFEEMTRESSIAGQMALYEQARARKERVRAIVIPRRNATIRRLWVAAAASILITVSALVWRMEVRRPAAPGQRLMGNDVRPGGNKAILTLANGTSITLDSSRNGMVAQQGTSRLVQSKTGFLSYEQMTGKESGPIMYNTVATPRGGQYKVVLPDGSRVWLNADSYLRFPTSFSAKERKVEIGGEAYLEVAAKKDAPFRVKVRGMEVEVLGTRFDVMSYADEPGPEATLLEGRIKVSVRGKEVVLHPGQQARETEVTDGVDTEATIAWKEGLFEFHKSDIGSVMRQIARWYDVEVIYEGPRTTHSFSGSISRDNNASAVLRVLELSGVHFRIEGRKIIVMP